MSKKVLIMADPAERLSHEGQRLTLGPGPIPTSDIEAVFKAVDIYRAIGRLDHAVGRLEDTSKLHEERLHQLTRQADGTTAILPGLERVIAQHTKDLNGLGQVAHNAKLFGYAAFWIALTLASGVGVAILTFLYHHAVPFLK